MIAATRKECGDSRFSSPASLSRRLTSSQIRSVVRGLPVSVFVRPTAERNEGPAVSDRGLRVYPESYAALFLTYLNGIGFRASSGASRLIIPPMALILIQASLDSVRRS